MLKLCKELKTDAQRNLRSAILPELLVDYGQPARSPTLASRAEPVRLCSALKAKAKKDIFRSAEGLRGTCGPPENVQPAVSAETLGRPPALLR